MTDWGIAWALLPWLALLAPRALRFWRECHDLVVDIDSIESFDGRREFLSTSQDAEPCGG